MHNNNKHKDGYNFEELIIDSPILTKYVIKNEYNNLRIDFSDYESVYNLNKALLKKYYGILNWEIPNQALCPPVPSRVEYIHILNDLLKKIPNKKLPISGLDIGVGTNCIFPILGSVIYDWYFKGSDTDETAVFYANKNISQSKELTDHITITHQVDRGQIFKDIINQDEYYYFTVCNPPFFKSETDALKASVRKWKNLNRKGNLKNLNFGGFANELWCNGGELLFIKRMIKESVMYQNQVYWFTSLVSQKANLKPLYKILNKFKAKNITIPLNIGNKKSRILVWTFQESNE